MKRSEYLKTVEGQVGLRRKRWMRQLHFMLDGLEPKSKNAILPADKLAFQRAILTNMEKRKRRYFKAPVALEFDFFPTKNDPPAIHTMPKNYLDLLEVPVADVKTKRRRLLLDDDRQVSYLAVKYHIPTDKQRPSIHLKVSSYRDFLADIELLQKVQRDELCTDSNRPFYRSSSISWDELAKDDEVFYSDDAVDRLREHENNEQFWISHYGNDVYEAFHEMLMIDVQNHLLKTLALTPSKLIHLLTPCFADYSPEFDSIHAVSRSNFISPPLTIDLKHSNLNDGDSTQYKAFVKETIASFREKYRKLFPLKAQVGITILFQPPASGSIDLDNLARRIVPFVNEVLKPPSNRLLMVNAERVKDIKLKKWYQEKQKALKRMPKHSITHYQVVQLPRLSEDSAHGFVRLLLEPGEPFETLWSKVQQLVDRWQDKV